MNNKIKVSLSELNDGGLQQRFNNELKKVAENIMDPNTDETKKRKIQINIDVIPRGNRDAMGFEIEVKSTLLPRKKVYADVLIDSDGVDIYANELRSGQPGQTFFDPDDSTLKDDKGQPIEEIEEKTENMNPIDKIKTFQRKA